MDGIPQNIWESASVPLTFGGLAHWGDWANCLEMVQNRHPHIVSSILEGWPLHSRVFEAIQESGDRLIK